MKRKRKKNVREMNNFDAPRPRDEAPLKKTD